MSKSTKATDTQIIADSITDEVAFAQQLEKAGASISAVQIPKEEKKEE